MKIFNKMKENCSADVMLLALISFFTGLIVGFIISPVKNGIAIGSYNGCSNRITDSNKIGDKSVKDGKPAKTVHRV